MLSGTGLKFQKQVPSRSLGHFRGGCPVLWRTRHLCVSPSYCLLSAVADAHGGALTIDLCVCVRARAHARTQLCPTLCDPMDCSPPGSSVHGILQARTLDWVAISSLQGICPTQGSNLCLLCLPALAGEFFTTSNTWDAWPGSNSEGRQCEDEDFSQQTADLVDEAALAPSPSALVAAWNPLAMSPQLVSASSPASNSKAAWLGL